MINSSLAQSYEVLDKACMPDLSIEDVRDIQSRGFARIGRAFGFVTVDGLLLSALHRDDGDNGHPKKGLRGPVSETVSGRLDSMGRLLSVEPMHQTFARCVLEELGTVPSNLPLYLGHSQRCPDTVWPIDAKRKILAQTAILFLDPGFDSDQFARTFKPTLELESIEFITIDQFTSQKLRPGAKEWMESLDTLGFFKPTTSLVKAVIADPRPRPLVVDLRLDSMQNL